MSLQKTDYDPRRLVLVTAADEAYAGCLGQLLANLRHRGLASLHRTLVYDLGISPERREKLARAFPWADFRKFDFAGLPPHLEPKRMTYAWKPVVIAEAAALAGGPLLWLDSACHVRTDLTAVHEALAADGLYLLRGQSSLRLRCDPEVALALAAEPPLLDQREFVAGVIALDPGRSVVNNLIREWRALALDPKLATPQRDRYNPEQSLLTLLVLRGLAAGRLTLSRSEDVDISSPEPASWVATRQKVGPRMPYWAWPAVRLRYALVKAIDQFLHRVKRFKATRVNGLHRLPKEHFQVYVRRAEAGGFAVGQPVAIPGPRWGYYADPFPWRREGSDWLFVEEFSYTEHAARLVALPLDAALHTGRPTPLEFDFRPSAAACGGGVRIEARHLSFPYLFEDAGVLYLVPESCAVGAVDLFACEAFPGRWRWVRRLLAGVDAADTALLRHEGRWWLFTSLRRPDGEGRALALYHTDDLLKGRWEAHPANAELRYENEPYTTGRCAGSFVRTEEGFLLRPIHASRRYYGQNVAYRRIEELTTTVYRETEYNFSPPAPGVSPHHVGRIEGLVAYDIRTRVSYGQHVPLWRAWALRPDTPAAGQRTEVAS